MILKYGWLYFLLTLDYTYILLGFLCPVHTPDGTPCGLLNHLSHTCRIITETLKVSKIPALLAELGVSMNVSTQVLPDDLPICVQLDGKIIGWCDNRQAKKITDE